MGRIRRLPEELIQKIAAGEVVDGPASVIKELVENSIDAGASKIRVEIERGGISRLLVSDDGCGLTPEEMVLAVERHTTSKIATAEDLRHIQTLGFRGEALAAICAVARVRLVSRTPEAAVGHALLVEGGRILEVKPAAHPVGTTVEVADLFFNVPARRKFLSSPAAEARRSLELLRHLALAHHDRGFQVLSEGRRVVLDVPAVRTPLMRLGQIYGEALARRLVAVNMEEPGYRLLALFSPPELVQSSRADQHLFLNRRPVRMGHLAVPIYQVYARFLGRGQHPLFFLYLEVDPEMVDVNVHPKKEEVRFQNDEAVMDLLRRAALRALGAFSPTWTGAAVPIPRPSASPSSTPQPARKEELLALREPGERNWRLLGQVQRAYIVVETAEGLEIVDQHAAHERVLLEKFQEDAEIQVQRFLIPVQVELPFDQAEALRAGIPALRALGVELEPFGTNAFLVRGWPLALAERQAKLGFAEPLQAVAALWRAGRRELWELWREVACAAAVRAGEELSPAEQEALIIAWKNTKEPARCPHGRPIAVKLTFPEIREKLGR